MRLLLIQLTLFILFLVVQFGVLSALPSPWHTVLLPVVLAPWWLRARWYAFEHIGWWPMLMGITADVMSPYPFGTMTIGYLVLAWTVRLLCIRLIPRLSIGSYTIVVSVGLLVYGLVWVVVNTLRAEEPWRTAAAAFGSAVIPMAGYSFVGSLIIFLIMQRFGAFDHVRRA